MPSPRSSPAMRPSSPLSSLTPRFEVSSRSDYLQPPASRSFHPRGSPQQRRANASSSLALPNLPRYHPANFPSSQHSSVANTPSSGPTSPHTGMVMSPGIQQKLYSDAQKQLYSYQRETMARATSSTREKPVSPRLAPLGSPGPVTPLELEEADNYLTAGARAANRIASAENNHLLVEKLAAAQQGALPPGRPPTSGHHR